MSKNKQKKTVAQPQTARQFVQSRGRQLKLYRHSVSRDYEGGGLAHVLVSRLHNDGYVSYAAFLVDLLARGIRDCHFEFHVEPEQFEEMMQRNAEQTQEVSYELAHNIVWAGHDYGVENNLPQHTDFSWLQTFLEPDESVALMDITLGDGGQPFLVVDTTEHYAPLIKRLTQAVGENNFRLQVNHQGKVVPQEVKSPRFAGTHANPESYQFSTSQTETADDEESNPLPSEAHHPEHEDEAGK